MKNKLVVIVGLPGSGKTTLINNNYRGALVYDDFKGGAVLDCSIFTFSRHYPELISELRKQKKDIVISDISFCDARAYIELKSVLHWWIKTESLYYEMQTIFFENNPEQCKANLIKVLNSEKRVEMVDHFTGLYAIENIRETNDEILKVYSDQNEKLPHKK